jgi:hypothetical protein
LERREARRVQQARGLTRVAVQKLSLVEDRCGQLLHRTLRPAPRRSGARAKPHSPPQPHPSTAQQPTRGAATDRGAPGRGGAAWGGRRRGGRAPAADASARRGPCPRPRTPPPRPQPRAAPPPRARRRARAAARARGGLARTSPSSRTLATPSASQRSSMSHDSNGTHSDSCGACARLSTARAPAGARCARCGQGAVLWRVLAGRAAASRATPASTAPAPPAVRGGRLVLAASGIPNRRRRPWQTAAGTDRVDLTLPAPLEPPPVSLLLHSSARCPCLLQVARSRVGLQPACIHGGPASTPRDAWLEEHCDATSRGSHRRREQRPPACTIVCELAFDNLGATRGAKESRCTSEAHYWLEGSHIGCRVQRANGLRELQRERCPWRVVGVEKEDQRR